MRKIVNRMINHKKDKEDQDNILMKKNLINFGKIINILLKVKLMMMMMIQKNIIHNNHLLYLKKYHMKMMHVII